MSYPLSYSRINSLLQCGEKFRLQYIEKVRTPRKAVFATGSAVHKAIEVNLANKRDQGDLLPESQVLEIGQDYFSTESKKGIDYDKEKEETETGSRDLITRLSKLHYKEVAPLVEPDLLEIGFNLQIAPDYHLNGFIDMIDRQGRIWDWKTASKSPNKGTAETSLQTAAYAAWYAQENDDMFPTVDTTILSLVNNKTPKVDRQDAIKTNSHIKQVLQVCHGAYEVIKSGMFTPCPPSGFGSVCAWCEFKKLCKYQIK